MERWQTLITRASDRLSLALRLQQAFMSTVDAAERAACDIQAAQARTEARRLLREAQQDLAGLDPRHEALERAIAALFEASEPGYRSGHLEQALEALRPLTGTSELA